MQLLSDERMWEPWLWGFPSLRTGLTLPLLVVGSVACCVCTTTCGRSRACAIPTIDNYPSSRGLAWVPCGWVVILLGSYLDCDRGRGTRCEASEGDPGCRTNTTRHLITCHRGHPWYHCIISNRQNHNANTLMHTHSPQGPDTRQPLHTTQATQATG